MSRLFDSNKTAKETRSREEMRLRAKQVEQALAETGELDEASARLGRALGNAKAVQRIHYETVRRPGSKWQLEHAVSGDDCLVQCFPLKTTRRPWQDVVPMMIGALDPIFPDTVQINYTPPSDPAARSAVPVNYYTIRIKGLTKLPGWERARDKALLALLDVDAWK